MAKALGKEPIQIELTEMEMVSILRAMSRWNKKLYLKIKIGLIEEMIKEGYDLLIEGANYLELKCKHCKKTFKV